MGEAVANSASPSRWLAELGESADVGSGPKGLGAGPAAGRGITPGLSVRLLADGLLCSYLGRPGLRLWLDQSIGGWIREYADVRLVTLRSCGGGGGVEQLAEKRKPGPSASV